MFHENSPAAAWTSQFIVYTSIYYVTGGVMARKSDTREKVRVLAEELVAKGIVPSSRKILEMLGNKGSLTTITDELANWERARNGDANPASEPPVQASTAEKEIPVLAALLERLTAQITLLTSNNESTSQQLEMIRAELVDLKRTHAEQLSVAYQRYEAVQRHALLQIDEARQSASLLREKVKALSLELDTREMAHSGKLQAAREENARLRGRLEAAGLGHEHPNAR